MFSWILLTKAVRIYYNYQFSSEFPPGLCCRPRWYDGSNLELFGVRLLSGDHERLQRQEEDKSYNNKRVHQS